MRVKASDVTPPLCSTFHPPPVSVQPHGEGREETHRTETSATSHFLLCLSTSLMSPCHREKEEARIQKDFLSSGSGINSSNQRKPSHQDQFKANMEPNQLHFYLCLTGSELSQFNWTLITTSSTCSSSASARGCL